MYSFLKAYLNNDKKILKEIKQVAFKIDSLKDEMAKLSDEQLAAKTDYLRDKIFKDKLSLDDILIEAYAVAREACGRKLGEYPYFVQLMGAVVLQFGDIAEMKTGEGKTLTAILPAYLNGLTKKGVHIITVNEYLSERDYNYARKVLEFLGLTVGLNSATISPEIKKKAYAADVTYTTNHELGFDYLRDNMVYNIDDKKVRSLNFAIIDEVDSILIDEARTPLIISGGTAKDSDLYIGADSFAKSLKRHHYQVDEEHKTVFLTEAGQNSLAKWYKIPNIYSFESSELIHLIQNALRANYVFKNGIEYIVRDNKIMLIDLFTGRIMENRSYSDGLQQAIQAKEKVEIEPENQIVATITYQNFFRLYEKISGMTGTAKTEEDEFRKIFNMRVIVVNTNKPIIRKDQKDLIFSSKQAKFKYITKKIKELHSKGVPILIGTTSVNISEEISEILTKEELPHNVLNAKNHTREAEIIAAAGTKSAITLSTNMAGRGTDIKISDEVVKLGGLYVMGTERHESRRIDNQLRGRSGRQGDPGISRFYLSIDDDLMVRFAGDKIRTIFKKFGDEAISSKLLTKALTNAQKKIEGLNYDTRKNLLEYDNILSQQRELIYSQRDKFLIATNTAQIIDDMIKHLVKLYIDESAETKPEGVFINLNTLKELILARLGIDLENNQYLDFNLLKPLISLPEKLLEKIHEVVYKKYYLIRSEVNPAQVDGFEKQLVLQVMDQNWIKHLTTIERLKHGIHFRSYAQKNPLQQFIEESSKIFEGLRDTIAKNILQIIFNHKEEHQNFILTPQDSKFEAKIS
ncbi:preprotein translocase subunit SecA [Mycoplasma sp. SG1]|nr:preprotein translocase subunit SecA [Mycoplasma sp. SG1]URM52981.1 preprotein translocase subunit SecA [Mycoplasma sp. SG1]